MSLKKPGSVSFQYFYPDSHMFFEFYVSTVASPELSFKEYRTLKALWSVKCIFYALIMSFCMIWDMIIYVC